MEEIIKNISSIIGIVGLVFGIFSKYYPELFFLKRIRKTKELLNLKTIKDLLSDDKEFEFKDFINSEIKEDVFAIRTGIETNSKSIEKLKKLKDELGLNFRWNNIKNARRFISLKGEKACIVISSLDYWVYIIFMFLSISIIAYLIYEISQIDKNLTFTFKAIFSSIYAFCIFLLLIFLRNSLNIIEAYQIKTRLKETRTKD